MHLSGTTYCTLWFFFFKQKTAYEMRISDWSSDVCSSDLKRVFSHSSHVPVNSVRVASGTWELCEKTRFRGTCRTVDRDTPLLEIGRASCRERVCQYV